MARDDPRGRPRRRDRSPDLDAVLADLAPGAGGALTSAVERALDDLLAGGAVRGAGPGRAARALVAALVAAGARGAELWARDDQGAGGWRRLAGAGLAVPDAERHVAGQHHGYPGTVAVARGGALALAFSGALPGSDERERREELAETLLALSHVLGAELPCAQDPNAEDPHADDPDAEDRLDEPGGPLRAA